MNTIRVEWAIARKGVTIASHSTTTIVLLPDAVRKLVAGAMFFNTGSAMFLPDSCDESGQNTPFSNSVFWQELHDSHVGLEKQLKDSPFEPDDYIDKKAVFSSGLDLVTSAMYFLRANPEYRLLIAGHTDRQGDNTSNQRLSESRARCVYSVFKGDRAGFVNECKSYHSNDDDMAMLAFAIRHLGWVDRNISDHSAAVKSFQEQYNNSFPLPITVDGVAGSQTFGAYYDCIDRYLAVNIGEIDIAQMRMNVRYVDNKIPWIGCGERFPVEAPFQDGVASQKNRRVELLLFAEDQCPNLAGHDPAAIVYGPGYRYEILGTSQARSIRAQTTPPAGSATEIKIAEAPAQPSGLGESSMDDFVTSMASTDVSRETRIDAWDFLEPLEKSLFYDDGTRMEYVLKPQSDSSQAVV